ncbi:Mpo1 family 2-hydroxy fatty acid dioxygenase [Mucilaginibacter lappiensis]|uniref:Putative membrane protein YGL010W n=1 Tax=Mucilaginibacter lappiensis TaxID=354630 RepID=A0A841JBY5_9SPHI|nr:Mpo1-like protein [Mucilaginibacter lappiensis]MBB6128144.1 putative membrane protein YGL010W [Mucilaginibacter lappiensis]
MASTNISNTPQNGTGGANNIRLVDVYFAKYAESHRNGTNEAIHFICIPLIVFSLLGLVWSIPFPYLKFLGSYNGVFNWASFLIAFSIYYYLKLSPVLSYIMLLILFGFSYAIIQLEHWHQAGGPALWLVSLIIFFISWVGQIIGHKIEGKKPSFLDDIKFLLIGPIYLLHLVLKKLSVKY